MATEKQIAANRANARRSTGPKSSAGKLKASRNAYQHGLSGPMPLDPATASSVDSLARELAGAQPTTDRLISGAEFVCAQLELLRIRSVRREQWSNIDLDGDTSDTDKLQSLQGWPLWTDMNVMHTPNGGGPTQSCDPKREDSLLPKRTQFLGAASGLFVPCNIKRSDPLGEAPGSSSSTRTVADRVYVFESRQSRSGENRHRRCLSETNPILSGHPNSRDPRGSPLFSSPNCARRVRGHTGRQLG
jgi:hypothetical protein